MLIKTDEGLVIEGDSKTTILDSAKKSNFIFDYSCKNGQCGVCKTTLKSGEVNELSAQLALTDSDKVKNKILTCCCSPATDILIEAKNLSVLEHIKLQISPVRISDLKLISNNVIEITLRLPPSMNFNFLEGQYIDVTGFENIKRSYSIASLSSDKEIRIIAKRVDGGVFSNYWFNLAKNNELLRIEGPKGTFFIREKQKKLIFLATGVGISPILAMLARLNNDELFIQKDPIYLYWGNRYQEEFFVNPTFKNLDVKINHVLSRPYEGWAGMIGYVQDRVLEEIHDLSDFHVYACGSNEMIKSAQKVFCEQGLSSNDFYSDAFLPTS